MPSIPSVSILLSATVHMDVFNLLCSFLPTLPPVLNNSLHISCLLSPVYLFHIQRTFFVLSFSVHSLISYSCWCTLYGPSFTQLQPKSILLPNLSLNHSVSHLHILHIIHFIAGNKFTYPLSQISHEIIPSIKFFLKVIHPHPHSSRSFSIAGSELRRPTTLPPSRHKVHYCLHPSM